MQMWVGSYPVSPARSQVQSQAQTYNTCSQLPPNSAHLQSQQATQFLINRLPVALFNEWVCLAAVNRPLCHNRSHKRALHKPPEWTPHTDSRLHLIVICNSLRHRKLLCNHNPNLSNGCLYHTTLLTSYVLRQLPRRRKHVAELSRTLVGYVDGAHGHQ